MDDLVILSTAFIKTIEGTEAEGNLQYLLPNLVPELGVAFYITYRKLFVLDCLERSYEQASH